MTITVKSNIVKVTYMGQEYFGYRPESESGREKLDLKSLKFDDFAVLANEVKDLSRKTFKETNRFSSSRREDDTTNAFINIEGQGVWLVEDHVRKTFKVQASSDMKEVHYYIKSGAMVKADKLVDVDKQNVETLKKGSADRDELMVAIRKMLEDLDFRVIE